ncbi:MAG: RNA polymerase sigma factor, partial [Bacteroidota bacterium]
MKPREKDHTDLELIDSFKEGDTDAFRLLVERYKDVSLSLACSILKDMHLAEDVLQDAFMKVYHKIHTFKYRASFATWLYRIVVNTSYNALKKEKNHLKVSEQERPELAVGWESEVPKVRQEEQQKYIQWALDKLRPDEALA